jgi:hypothetical protein
METDYIGFLRRADVRNTHGVVYNICTSDLYIETVRIYFDASRRQSAHEASRPNLTARASTIVLHEKEEHYSG